MIAKNHEKFKIFIKTYWQYFKELENEIIETRRYVDFLPDNYGTFSVEYLKLYQAICSEIDVIGKSVAGELDAGFKPEEKQNNIYKWWLVIQDELTFPSWNEVNFSWDYTSLTTAIVEFEDEQIIPWMSFRTEIRPDKNGVNHTEVVKGMKVPSWWSSYNKVKHHRTGMTKNSGASNPPKMNYSMANLGNVINSFAGLYVLELSYMHALGTKNDIEGFADHSRLFEKEMNATSEDMARMLDFRDISD